MVMVLNEMLIPYLFLRNFLDRVELAEVVGADLRSFFVVIREDDDSFSFSLRNYFFDDNDDESEEM